MMGEADFEQAAVEAPKLKLPEQKVFPAADSLPELALKLAVFVLVVLHSGLSEHLIRMAQKLLAAEEFREQPVSAEQMLHL